MLHLFTVRTAAIGGECALWLLMLLSIVSLAIISDRVWFFARYRLDHEQFARHLLQLLRGRDWPRVRAVVGRPGVSACQVVAAGLAQLGGKRSAIRSAMRSARVREEMRLEGQLGLLGTLGVAALLVGLLGTMCDLMHSFGVQRALPTVNSIATATPAFNSTAVQLPSVGQTGFDALGVLGPAVLGLMVAIPAIVAASLLKAWTRHVLRHIDSLVPLVVMLIDGQEAPAQAVKPEYRSDARAA